MLGAVLTPMLRRPYRIACCLFLSIAARAQGADTVSDGVRLSFVRAENATDCIAAVALQREIVRRMGHDPFEGPARQWIEGFIRRDADFFELQLFERDAEGTTLGSRRLREPAGDCHRLDDAIVLAIALIIDPTAQLAPPAPRRLDATAPNPAVATVPPAVAVRPASPPPPPAAPASATPRRDSLAVVEVAPLRESAAPTPGIVRRPGAAFASIDAVVLSGALPGAAFGAEVTTRMAVDSRERIALRLSGLFLPEKRQSTGAGDLGYSLTALELGACVNGPLGGANGFVGFGCAGFGLGAMHTVVRSPEPFKPDDRLWAAFRVEAGVNLRLFGPVWLGARVFDFLAPRRWDFNVRVNQQRVPAFSQKALMPGAALGVGLHFD